MHKFIKCALAFVLAANSGCVAAQSISNPPNPAGSGTVTSVGVGNIAGVTTAGSPVTTSGVVTQTLNGQSANTVFAAPNGSAGAPTFRAPVVADLSNLGTGISAALTSSANGSGAMVLTTSPAFVTPNLGTPSAAVLTNATGLPLSTGVSGILPFANEQLTGQINPIESFRASGYTDQQTVAAWAAAINSGAIAQSVGSRGTYTLTAQIVINLPAGQGYNFDISGVTLIKNFAGTSALLLQTATNSSAENFVFRMPSINVNGQSGDGLWINGGRGNAYTEVMYNADIMNPRVYNVASGNGIYIYGVFNQARLWAPVAQAIIGARGVSAGNNTTGYGLYIYRTITSADSISSLSVYEAFTDGFLHGVYSPDGSAADVCFYGTTTIRAWQEGFYLAYSFGVIDGVHSEGNWYSNAAVAGTSGAGTRIIGPAFVANVRGPSSGGQLYTYQGYVSGGTSQTIGSVYDNGANISGGVYGILQTDATSISSFTLLNTTPTNWSLSGQNIVAGLGGGAVRANAVYQTVQSLNYAASVTPVLGNGNSIQIAALTGNITIGPISTAIRAPISGEEITIAFGQDSVGGRVVTWDSSYKLDTTFSISTTAYINTQVTFVYWQSAWRQKSKVVQTY